MLTVSDLRCEYAENPLGLDVTIPRFSWLLTSDRRGAIQSAYRVLVATSAQRLEARQADVWDSGVVSSPRSVNIEYGGRPLASGERCYWTVQVRDGANQEACAAAPAWFEMGLLHPADWKSEWIGYPGAWIGRGLLFRCPFEITKPVARARAYAAGLGYYELRINGQKVGDRVLEPALTDYSKRVLYATYDVGDLLRAGKNAVAAMVGNGWYGVPKLLLQLEIVYADGSADSIWTGGRAFTRWSVATGPIVSNSVYDGEVWDARLERPGWDTAEGPVNPSRDRLDGWQVVMVVDSPGGRLVSGYAAPLRVVETRRAVELRPAAPGVWVADLGQNLAGWARIRVRGARGTRVSLRFAETLYADGTVNQENLRTARCEDVYILKGGGVEEWEPRFTYHGFRYVQVEGWPGELTRDDVEARVVRSAVERRGAFTCDHPLINRIQSNVLWTEASNLHGIPTDCPQRDERQGWLNDISARAEESIYNYDLVGFYAKWLADIVDAQDPVSGALTDTAPFRYGNRPADPVCACLLLLPWLLYQHYDDIRILRDHFDAMKKWVDCLTARSGDGLLPYGYYGDWAPPVHQAEQQGFGDNPNNASTPPGLVSTAFYSYSARLLATMAGILGYERDRETYRSVALHAGQAFNDRYWNEALDGYGTGSQSCNALPLYLGLVPPARVERVLAALVRDVLEKHAGHLATGNIGTKHLLEVLTAGGRTDVAFRIATQETYPSWGFMIAHGATTIWERWEHATGGNMNSHNHPMLCSVSSWFYRALAGIRVNESGPGFSSFEIRPVVPDGLGQAGAELKTVRGVVRSAWHKTGGRFVLDAEVPFGSEARVVIPKLAGAKPRCLSIDDITVWRNNGMAAQVEGLRERRDVNDGIELVVGSGIYQFIAEFEASIQGA